MNLGLSLGLSSRPGGGGAPAFSPASLVGVSNWYRSDTGITQSGGLVSQWNDLIGGAHLVQATGANQPAYNALDASYNNLPTLQASIASKWMQVTGPSLPQPITMWFVGEIGTSFTAIACLGATEPYIGQDGTPVARLNATTNLNSAISAAAKSAIVATANGASSYIGINTAFTAGVTGAAGASTMTGVAIFARPGGGAASTGKIAELIVQAGIPTAGEKTAMAAYFAARYGITVT